MSEPPKKRSDDWDPMFESLAASIAPTELSATARSRMASKIRERARNQPPEGTSTLRVEEGDWQMLAAGVTMKLLRIDHEAGNQTALVRFAAGSALNQHAHVQQEECFVLEGEIMIGSHVLRAGDMHIAAPGTEHEVIRSMPGALLLVRSDIVMTGCAAN
jgi:anti-sigma factor ChrR (cupin superfamily)